MLFYDYKAGQDVQGSAVFQVRAVGRPLFAPLAPRSILLSPPNCLHSRLGGSMKGFRKRWARAATDDATEDLEDDACARSAAGDPTVELRDGSSLPSLQWSSSGGAW